MKKNKLIRDSILITIISIFLILVYSLIDPAERKESSFSEIPEENEPEAPALYFGFIKDSFDIEHGEVGKNQYLAEILLAQDVDYATIDRIARKSRDTFDVRKIRRGQPWHILKSKDSLLQAQYFIYEIDAVDYAVFELRDSLDIYLGSRKVIITTDTVSGFIESSLWNAMAGQGQDPFLAVKLSEVYQWAIDFFGIQKGDWYKVIYEQKYIDTLNIGSGRILASAFGHADDVYYAFWYEQDSLGGDYFDEEANSLRRTFLKAPLRYSRISSRFSNSRMHPVLKIRRPHHGIDYAAPRGTPVYSIGDGVIIKKAYQKGGGGRYLKIKHNSVYTTVYMHLNGYANGIKSGKRVKQGELIGYVGSSGLATGPHLDFRVYRNGSPIDPLKMKSPPAKPVDSSHQEVYYKFIEKIIPLLEQDVKLDSDSLKTN